jgi:hypothetical protein
VRIWSIHPKYLDWMGLGAQWREGLLAQKVLLGETKGWKNHPQLNRFKSHIEPINAVGYYLRIIYEEAEGRDYNYNFSKILKPVNSVEKLEISNGQIEYEYMILMERLEKRSPDKFMENQSTNKIMPHPLFNVVKGPPESWEISYWRKREP